MRRRLIDLLWTDLRGLARDQGGASAVEFALLAPVLFALLAGTIDATVLIVRQMEVRAAAQAGADYALARGWNPAGVAAAVTTATDTPASVSAAPAPALTIGCVVGQAIVAPSGSNCPDGSAPGRYVTVSARADFKPIVPGFRLFAAQEIVSNAVVRVP